MRDPVARNCPEVEVPQELQSCDWGCCIRIDLYNQVVVSYPAWASYEEPGAMGNVMGVYYQVGRSPLLRFSRVVFIHRHAQTGVQPASHSPCNMYYPGVRVCSPLGHCRDGQGRLAYCTDARHIAKRCACAFTP